MGTLEGKALQVGDRVQFGGRAGAVVGQGRESLRSMGWYALVRFDYHYPGVDVAVPYQHLERD